MRRGSTAIKWYRLSADLSVDAGEARVGVYESLDPDVPDIIVDSGLGAEMEPVAKFVRVVNMESRGMEG